jgi:hypothetical protein
VWRLDDFGIASKKYALKKLEFGNRASFDAALSTIGAVNSKHNLTCTPAERAALVAAAKKSWSGNTLRAVLHSIQDACIGHDFR